MDHAIKFKNSDWLIIVDAFSQYPTIHKVSSTSATKTIACLAQDFSHFGFPHAIAADNAFSCNELNNYLEGIGSVLLVGAPYHPQTNGMAERMVQSFKRHIDKSDLPVDEAVLEFLMIYRRTPLPCGKSPAELQMGRQIRSYIDTLFPNLTTQRQAKQVKPASAIRSFKVEDLVFAADYRGDKRQWTPAVINKCIGSRLYVVKTTCGLLWRRHIDQLKYRPQ